MTPDATYDSPVQDPVGIGGEWVSGEDKKLVVLGGPEARTVVVTDGIGETVEAEYEVTLDEEYDPTGISFGKQAYLADSAGPKYRTLLQENAFDFGDSIPGAGTKGIGANAGGNPMIIIEKGGSEVIIEVQNRTRDCSVSNDRETPVPGGQGYGIFRLNPSLTGSKARAWIGNPADSTFRAYLMAPFLRENRQGTFRVDWNEPLDCASMGRVQQDRKAWHLAGDGTIYEFTVPEM